MLILGIDTSCDDTAASVAAGGTRILSNIVSSQNEVHRKYGGIVPELASRRHIEMIWPVVDEALRQANITPRDLSAIAVCHGPGLIGSLLVGVCFAKSMAYVSEKPLVAVNHLEGHIFSSFLEKPAPEFPFIALVVSGGHTNIYRVEKFGDYTELGRTVDDAAGEAFDKVAKLLGLGYPGGPAIEALSEKGNPDAIYFPRPLIDRGGDFSFSGLKTAVRAHLEKNNGSKTEDITAGFQSAVIDVLVEKTVNAAKKEGLDRIVLAGGVSTNNALRQIMSKRADIEKLNVYFPSQPLCVDNAAMIASAGYFRFLEGDFAGLDLNPRAFLPLGVSL